MSSKQEVFDIHETTAGRERVCGEASFEAAVRWIAGVVGIDPNASADKSDVRRMEIPGEVWHFEHNGRRFEVEHLAPNETASRYRVAASDGGFVVANVATGAKVDGVFTGYGEASKAAAMWNANAPAVG